MSGDKLPIVERLEEILPLLEELETGQECEEYAFARAKGFQAMTYVPSAFEALRCIPQAATTITELLAERAAILRHIPMDYLERHGVGTSAPADAEKLERAMRDYAEDRWKLLDRLKAALSNTRGDTREQS